MVNLREIRPKFITDENGEKQSVVIPISVFEELLEDLEDLASVAERRDEPTISHKELLEELKKDALL